MDKRKNRALFLYEFKLVPKETEITIISIPLFENVQKLKVQSIAGLNNLNQKV